MFVKGQSGNPAGRAKGKKTRGVERIRNFFQDFVENNIEKIQDNFDQLTPQEQLKFILEFSEYILPKLSRAELTGKDGDQLPAPVIILNDGDQPINKPD